MENRNGIKLLTMVLIEGLSNVSICTNGTISIALLNKVGVYEFIDQDFLLSNHESWW